MARFARKWLPGGYVDRTVSLTTPIPATHMNDLQQFLYQLDSERGQLVKNVNYQMLDDDGFVLADCSGGNITITLPDATHVQGRQLFIKRTTSGGNLVTVAAKAGQFMDGAASVILRKQYDGLRVVSDGTNWIIPQSVAAAHNPVTDFSSVVSFLTATLTNLTTDPDGTALTYVWNFGDGATSAAANPVHVYANPGTYTVTLTATNAAGLSSSMSHQVVAASPPPQRRPFADTSPWNKKLNDIFPGGVPVAPLSQKYLDDVVAPTDVPTAGPYYFWSSDVTQYTMPVYIVDINTTPLHTVAYSGVKGESSDASTVRTNGPGTQAGIPIPANIKPAPGSDSQVILWDPVAGQFWDFWACVVDGSGFWATNGLGQYQCTNFSHFSGEQASAGVPSTQPNPYPSRGAGVPYIAGLVRKWEMDLGVVDHAIAFAFDTPANTFVYPASKSDGTSTPDQDMPEGTRIKLRDNFPVQDLADPYARVVAAAMRDYGMICIDHAGNPKIYAEADVSVGLSAEWGGQFIVNLLREIPMTDFVVVDPNGTSTTREIDIRIDPTKGDDPLPAAPAITGTVLGNFYNAGVALAGAQAMPTIDPDDDEPVLLELAIRGSNDSFVSSVTGWGASWRRIARRIETRKYAQNISTELWMCRPPNGSGSAAVQITPAGNVIAITARLYKFTTGSAIRKVWGHDFASLPATTAIVPTNTPQVRLRGTTPNSFVLGMMAHRAGNGGANAANGETAQNLNDSTGAGGDVIKLSNISKVGGGDVLFLPTLSAATEWHMHSIEIT
jgi:PKD repeat protein